MKKKYDLLTLVQLAMLIAIQLVTKAIGLGSVPVGPALYELPDTSECSREPY